MNTHSIIENLNKISRQSVVIVGDIILDHYQWGEVTRISPEAPVPVVKVEEETYRLGGAANVAKNIRSMGGDPYLVGVIGDDEHGSRIKNLLKEDGISSGIHVSGKRKTTIKTRVMGNSQQIVRIDKESDTALGRDESGSIEKKLHSAGTGSFVIVSDYGKGLINRHNLGLLKGRKSIIDPKIKNFSSYKDIFLMTPNRKEAQEGSGLLMENKTDIIRAGRKILKKNNSENLLVTMGPEGMVLFKGRTEIIHINTSARKVYDVTGAGDTVIGVLGLCLEAGIDLESSCVLANFAAGIVVGQVGTASAGKEEVEKSINKIGIPEINRWDVDAG
jgi:D-glycero-beta-D-manno-heptose-7-phosphate kinase